MSDAQRAALLLAVSFTSVLAQPVQFVVDTSRAPDLKPWSERAIETWQQAYPMICEELASPGFHPPATVRITIDPVYDGIAEISASGIALSAKFVRTQPGDAVAAVVHEIAHAVQSYGNDIPMWLVDGIADYVRFFRWRTGELGHINPDRAHYYGSYRITASFLNYLVEHYDPDIVRKLNQACREGRYRDSIFVSLTGKKVDALGAEWHATLPRTAADFASDAETDVEEETSLIWRILAGAALGGAVGMLFTALRLWRSKRRDRAVS